MRSARPLLTYTSALLLAGCATIESGGHTVLKDDAEKAFDKIRGRAAFEMSCPKEKLQVVVLADEPGAGFFGNKKAATQIGVSGCDRKGVYVRMPDNSWVLNSESKQEK